MLRDLPLPNESNRRFRDGAALWEAFKQYEQWCIDNPVKEFKTTTTGDMVAVPKPRAMNIQGFAGFCGVTSDTVYKWFRQKDKASENMQLALGLIQDRIFDQNFTEAAAGTLNQAIIMRKLGLADRQDVKQTSENVEHVVVYQLPDNNRAAAPTPPPAPPRPLQPTDTGYEAGYVPPPPPFRARDDDDGTGWIP